MNEIVAWGFDAQKSESRAFVIIVGKQTQESAWEEAELIFHSAYRLDLEMEDTVVTGLDRLAVFSDTKTVQILLPAAA